MRNYILTDRERTIIISLTETDRRLEGLSMLKIRARANLPRLREDLELTEKFLKAVDARGRESMEDKSK